MLSCAILGTIIYVTSLFVQHVFILPNKVKSNQMQSLNHKVVYSYFTMFILLDLYDNTVLHMQCCIYKQHLDCLCIFYVYHSVGIDNNSTTLYFYIIFQDK